MENLTAIEKITAENISRKKIVGIFRETDESVRAAYRAEKLDQWQNGLLSGLEYELLVWAV